VRQVLDGLAAVYRYATEGLAGEFFDADLVQNAFLQKK